MKKTTKKNTRADVKNAWAELEALAHERDKDKVAAQVNIPQLSLVCRGCNGDRVQLRTSDGITILCPVCNGSGSMPPVTVAPAVPFKDLFPYPSDKGFWQPYPWQQSPNSLPSHPFPGQIID